MKVLRQIGDLQTTFDGVVIGDGDEIHPGSSKLRDAVPADRNNCQENRSAGIAIPRTAR